MGTVIGGYNLLTKSDLWEFGMGLTPISASCKLTVTSHLCTFGCQHKLVLSDLDITMPENSSPLDISKPRLPGLGSNSVSLNHGETPG
ncbi:hypothetical protein VTO42DRAFT_7666 [Malbranchea cinnamomea]